MKHPEQPKESLSETKQSSIDKRLSIESVYARLEYYHSLLRSGKSIPKETLLPAAQEIAKIYIDWDTETRDHDCPVTYETMVEMMSRFGAKAISALSETSKQFKP
jgi:hypothetical protein